MREPSYKPTSIIDMIVNRPEEDVLFADTIKKLMTGGKTAPRQRFDEVQSRMR